MSANPDPMVGSGDDIRPWVASKTSRRSALLFIGVATMAAGLLFYTLENRRASLAVSNVWPAVSSSAEISSPPALSIPVMPEGYAQSASYAGAHE